MEAGGLELTADVPGRLRGRERRPGLLPARRRAAALLRRHLEPLGRLVPRARRLRLRAQALQPAAAAGRSARSTSIPTGRETDAHPRHPRRDRGAGPADRQAGYDFRRFQFRWSPPTHFGEKYAAEIAASERIRLVLNANLVDLRLDDDLGAVDRGGLPRLRARRSRLHRPGARLLPLHRRHRERAAAAQLPQPDARGHRQPPRPGRPVLLRASALRAGRRAAARSRWPRCEFYAPDRELHRRARVPELRPAARADGSSRRALVRAGARGPRRRSSPILLERAGARARHRPRARRGDPRCWCRPATPACCASPTSRRSTPTAGCARRRARRLRPAPGRARLAPDRARRPHHAHRRHGLRRAPGRAGHRPRAAARLAAGRAGAPSPACSRTRSAASITWAPPAWPTTRATASSTATAACTGSPTSTSAARASSPAPATPTPTYTLIQLALRLGDHLAAWLRG